MPTTAKAYRPRKIASAKKSQQRVADQQFYDSKEWLRCRKAFLQEHPLCQRCDAVGNVRPAKDVHHKIPKKHRPDLALDPSNLEALCKSCHSRGEGQLRRKVRAERIVVTGTTGSGKTTYVNQRRRRGDVVWDWDAVLETLTGQQKHEQPRRDMISALTAMRDTLLVELLYVKRKAWVIASNKETARGIANVIGARMVDCDTRLTGGPKKSC